MMIKWSSNLVLTIFLVAIGCCGTGYLIAFSNFNMLLIMTNLRSSSTLTIFYFAVLELWPFIALTMPLTMRPNILYLHYELMWIEHLVKFNEGCYVSCTDFLEPLVVEMILPFSPSLNITIIKYSLPVSSKINWKDLTIL